MEKETPRCENCGAVGMDDHNDWCEAGKRAQEETPTNIFGKMLEDIRHVGRIIDGKMVCDENCPAITHRSSTSPETPYEKKLRELKEAYEKEVAEAKKEYQEDIESAMKGETPENNGWKCGNCGEEIEVTPLTFVNPHICKETPDEHDQIIRDKSGQSIGIDRSKYTTPTEEVETRGIETCGEALEVVSGVQRRIAEAKDIETPTEEWAKKKV